MMNSQETDKEQIKIDLSSDAFYILRWMFLYRNETSVQWSIKSLCDRTGFLPKRTCLAVEWLVKKCFATHINGIVSRTTEGDIAYTDHLVTKLANTQTFKDEVLTGVIQGTPPLNRTSDWQRSKITRAALPSSPKHSYRSQDPAYLMQADCDIKKTAQLLNLSMDEYIKMSKTGSIRMCTERSWLPPHLGIFMGEHRLCERCRKSRRHLYRSSTI